MLRNLLSFYALVMTATFANSGELDVGYDSRYISEGRNNLVAGGITWVQLNHDLKNGLSLLGLYGAGKDYDELNLGIVYTQTYSDVEYYFSYTRLEFFEDNLHDNELGLGAGYSFSTAIPLRLAVDAVYSIEAHGMFVEFSLGSDLTVNEALVISPYIKAGLDVGYASDGKKGHNHSALGAVVAILQSDSLSYNLSLEHSIAQQHVKKETNQKNHSWFGFHLVYNF